ncbi:hypothetical protein GZH47_12370 [Paenibacillus rhizovicinus]|uniref:Secreted protein n=1 Tax=Paenibacillus rhizovicinus TaxID=2704463 RepID=A0A6C0NZA8_9BACL|nr:hypothetical protein [Paenibacillus rhizovicinus]QHW31558.1 hypothetical protein GZH47_12370 [Paenibacillus rhizovicinus]
MGIKRRIKKIKRALATAVVLLALGVAAGYWMSGYAKRGLPVTAVESGNLQDRPAHSGMMDMEQEGGEGESAAGAMDEHDGAMNMDMPANADGADGAQWVWPAGVPEAGETGKLRVTITGKDGKPDAGLQINHEKKLHLIVVSEGLSTFMHMHPVETAEQGVFDASVTFPAAGRYELIADFKTPDGSQQWQSTWVQTGGASGKRQAEPALAADQQLTRAADGMAVSLAFDKAPKAGESAALTFSFADQATGSPVRDLQPYLGAAGHVVILDAEAKHYLHVHAMDDPGGPTAMFHTTFPSSGLYKIWGQFQRKGRIVTVPFVVKVG